MFNPLAIREAEDERYDKAVFCLRTGIQPSEYDALTDEDLDAFVKAFNDLSRRK